MQNFWVRRIARLQLRPEYDSGSQRTLRRRSKSVLPIPVLNETLGIVSLECVDSGP